MPLSEFEIKKIESIFSEYCEKKIPLHVRDQLVLTFKINRNEVVLFEKRVVWDNPSEWREHPVTKMKCNMQTRLWTLYWLDRNSKFHIYERIKPSKYIETLLKEVNSDPTGIFWG